MWYIALLKQNSSKAIVCAGVPSALACDISCADMAEDWDRAGSFVKKPSSGGCSQRRV